MIPSYSFTRDTCRNFTFCPSNLIYNSKTSISSYISLKLSLLWQVCLNWCQLAIPSPCNLIHNNVRKQSLKDEMLALNRLFCVLYHIISCFLIIETGFFKKHFIIYISIHMSSVLYHIISCFEPRTGFFIIYISIT